MGGKDWASRRKVQVWNSNPSRNTKAYMMKRKEPKQCRKWGGEVERIQIMDNLKCQEEFMFDSIGSSLLPTKHFPEQFYMSGIVKQIQIMFKNNLVGMTDK